MNIKSGRYARLMAVVVGALAATAMFSSMAQAQELNAGYTQFAGCPNPFTENANYVTCVRSVITGGNFKMGNKDVPIEKPITLTGGVENEFKNFAYNSEGGLTKVKQTVPGGIVGLTGLNWLLEVLSVEQLKLYAVTELAGTPTFTDLNNVTLPIKVHLINPILGESCYVGSSTKPITLNLTTGTTSPPAPNKPITGKPAKTGVDPVLEIFFAKEGIFVDNSFAAPGASGCVLQLGLIPVNIDGLINVASGLPSAAGKNETKQNFELELVNSEFPYE